MLGYVLFSSVRLSEVHKSAKHSSVSLRACHHFEKPRSVHGFGESSESTSVISLTRNGRKGLWDLDCSSSTGYREDFVPRYLLLNEE